MYYLLIAIHVIACLFLIATILLQAGKGGGLTETFTGQAQSVLGTQAPAVLKKATAISAIVFLTLSLVLAILTSYRSKSLFQQIRIPGGTSMPMAMPVTPVDGSSEQANPAAVPLETASASVPADSAAAPVPLQESAGTNK